MKTTNEFYKLDMSKVPIAHRGLWGNGIPENSLSSYAHAKEKGFPVEIDLYKSKDGEIFSVHDRNLLRLTGKDIDICKAQTDTIKNLFIQNSKERIPTLKETLDVIDGKVPVLIELKNQPDKTVISAVAEILSAYKGEFAVQSFNPIFIKRFKKLMPQAVAGILTTKKEEDLKDETALNKFIVKRTPLNFIVKPDFISAEKSAFPIKSKRYKLAWTITSEEEYEKIKPFADNVIFEGFIPKK